MGDSELRESDLPSLPAHDLPPIHRIHFRSDTVRRELSRLVPSKATGSDGIPARVLKECCWELASPVSRLFALSFKTGFVPTMWKLAHVVPIYKKPPRSLPSNYRPVSLLPILSKIKESIVNRQVVKYLERHKLLPDSQYGFRHGRGTADVLTVLQNEWAQTVADGGCVPVVAVDIAGAFDRVSHVGLVHKIKSMGIGGLLLAWLTNYLHDRKLKVVVGGHTSTSYPIEAGVPQGSVLGPTLFLLYVADIDQCLMPSTRLSSFADDTTIYSLVSSPADLPRQVAALQGTLDRLASWGRQWCIRFEPAKSQLLVLSKSRNRPVIPAILFDGVRIQEHDKLKLLGVVFDWNLTFHDHLHKVAVRASHRLGYLRRTAHLLDHRGRLSVYKGFIRPVLEYAPLVMMSAAKTHLQQLDRVQAKAMRLIIPRHSSTESCCTANSGWLDIPFQAPDHRWSSADGGNGTLCCTHHGLAQDAPATCSPPPSPAAGQPS